MGILQPPPATHACVDYPLETFDLTSAGDRDPATPVVAFEAGSNQTFVWQKNVDHFTTAYPGTWVISYASASSSARAPRVCVCVCVCVCARACLCGPGWSYLFGLLSVISDLHRFQYHDAVHRPLPPRSKTHAGDSTSGNFSQLYKATDTNTTDLTVYSANIVVPTEKAAHGVFQLQYQVSFGVFYQCADVAIV